MGGWDIKRLKNNLAVHIDTAEDETLIVLYDCSQYNITENDIKAVCTMSKHLVSTNRVFAIDHICAVKGFGPLMALIAMDHSGVNGVVLNLDGELTDSARYVWEQFYDGEGSRWVDRFDFDHPVHSEPSLSCIFTNNFVIPNLEEAKTREVVDEERVTNIREAANRFRQNIKQ